MEPTTSCLVRAGAVFHWGGRCRKKPLAQAATQASRRIEHERIEGLGKICERDRMTGEFESKDTTRKQSRGGEGESEREKTEFGVCSLIQQTSAAVRVSPLLHMFSVLYAVLKGCRLQQPV